MQNIRQEFPPSLVYQVNPVEAGTEVEARGDKNKLCHCLDILLFN